MRSALPVTRLPGPNDLAGLACEESIESRIIIGTGTQWQLRHGPFTDDDFHRLPDRDWTLLVQAVDHFLPEVADLLDYFRFLPNWRIDDVMVSYASPGGSVGPHFDYYDVFLIQGSGQRLWKIGQHCDASSALLSHPELRLLDTFAPSAEYLLEPGDILYLPPGIAHWGISQSDDCMTYSVGFRAPTYGEVLASLCDDLLSKNSDDDRYRDPSSDIDSARCGEIDPAVVDTLQIRLNELINNRDALVRSFGRMMTETRYDNAESVREAAAPDTFAEIVDASSILRRDPAARFAYWQSATGEPRDCVDLFVNGRMYRCEGDAAVLARLLCNHRRYSGDQLHNVIAGNSDAEVLLLDLVNQQYIFLDDDCD